MDRSANWYGLQDRSSGINYLERGRYSPKLGLKTDRPRSGQLFSVTPPVSAPRTKIVVYYFPHCGGSGQLEDLALVSACPTRFFRGDFSPNVSLP
jgi:hypothetical protein